MAVPGTSAGSKIYAKKPPPPLPKPKEEELPSPIANELSSTMMAVKSIMAGTISGIISKVVDHPLDTVKVRLQAQLVGSSSPHFNGVGDCLRVTIKNEGFGALYKVLLRNNKGSLSPIAVAAVENAALFVCFEQYKSYCERNHIGVYEPTVRDSVIGGALSGFVSTAITTPIEVLKTRMQTNPHTNHYRVLIPHIMKHEGFFNGLYKGTTATALREVPGNAVWFGTYEGICLGYENFAKCPREEVPVWVLTAAGAFAVPYPMDTIKTVIQNSETKLRIIPVAKQIVAENGLRGLYQGWVVTIARSAPSSAVVFVAYEFLNRWLGKMMGEES